MAAPSGTVWGSIVNGSSSGRKGRLGIYTSVSSTDTETTVNVQVWFWTIYSCSDGAANTLYYDTGTNVTSATTTAASNIDITHTIATGEGWNTANQTLVLSKTHKYTRGASAITHKVYAKFSGIDMLNGAVYANTTFTVPALVSYTVSYDANGGSGVPSKQTKLHGVTLTLSASTPTRTGYNFSNWLSSAQNQSYDPGDFYGHNESTTMVAQWAAKTYTVSYNANGGEEAPGNQTKTYGTTLKLSSKQPTRKNYNFLGWATSSSATTATYHAGDNYTDNVGITLYAVWELAYIKPVINNITAIRCDSAGVKKDDGTYANVQFEWKTQNEVTEVIVSWLSTSAGFGSKPLKTSTTGNSEIIGTDGKVSTIIGGSLSTDSSYTITVSVKDSETTTATITLAGKAFPIDFLAGGKGVAFGKAAEKQNAVTSAWDYYDKFDTLIGAGLAAYTGGGDTGIDPNTTLEELCLTSHRNGPQGVGTFYYIHTVFYNTKSTTAARAQFAMPYNKTGSLYHRYFISGSWSSWSRYMTSDEIYPVGSVVIRYDTTSPATLYGGTWQRIEGRMLYGCASSGTVGATGTHTTGSGSSSLPYVNVAIWRRTA